MSDRHPVLARYNAWANHKLYRAVEALPDAEFRADRGVFFKSLRGTLNHLLVTDRVWMARFTGAKTGPLQLDTILHDDFASLQAAREAEDTRIIGYVDGLDAAASAGTFTYQRMSSLETYVAELRPALDHLFNHQTHHRGQAHAVLTGLGVEAPVLDLARFYGEVGHGGLIRIA
ncbi:DinB family protein [Lichenibacterium ramalinae]|uniref:Damage-inducible protein DinB n=1 Tax=Lichenibacterium ramalinae TaxID=2316527 RepID=A0A4V1RIZ1_9HYPH|nr:DinB family protein [Lichenibacterium ramalinae]RYB06311.1 damage-inducible protein DinB [Lichenibacterium ramalinae]